jgi:hypothetical protein
VKCANFIVTNVIFQWQNSLARSQRQSEAGIQNVWMS